MYYFINTQQISLRGKRWVSWLASSSGCFHFVLTRADNSANSVASSTKRASRASREDETQSRRLCMVHSMAPSKESSKVLLDSLHPVSNDGESKSFQRQIDMSFFEITSSRQFLTVIAVIAQLCSVRRELTNFWSQFWDTDVPWMSLFASFIQKLTFHALPPPPSCLPHISPYTGFAGPAPASCFLSDKSPLRHFTSSDIKATSKCRQGDDKLMSLDVKWRSSDEILGLLRRKPVWTPSSPIILSIYPALCVQCVSLHKKHFHSSPSGAVANHVMSIWPKFS